jgi:hypothetical protein
MKITESQLRQSVSQLLKEEVYGTLATVYHGSHQPPEEFLKVFEDESGKVGWKVDKGSGSSYGHGLYTVWMQTDHSTFGGIYGNWIYKFKVNLYGFIIFDAAVCQKVYGSVITPLEQLERLGKKDVIQRLTDEIKNVLSKPPARDERSSEVASKVSKYLAGAVNGIVFFGGGDGPVVVIYDPNIVTPIGYAKLKDAKWGIWIDWKPEEIRHSRARAAQGGTYADPTRLQSLKIGKKIDLKIVQKILNNASFEEGKKILNKIDTLSAEQLLNSGELKKEFVKHLALSGEDSIKFKIALKSVDNEILEILSKDVKWPPRAAVAKNENTSDEIIQTLIEDPSAIVRGAIAGRDNISYELIKKFAKDADANVRFTVLKRKNLSDEILEILETSEETWISSEARERLRKKQMQEMKLRKLISFMIT